MQDDTTADYSFVPDDLVERVQAAYDRQEQRKNATFGDLGITLSEERLAELEARLQEPVSFREGVTPDATNVPLTGAVVETGQLIDFQRLATKFQAGEATEEEQDAFLSQLVEQARPRGGDGVVQGGAIGEALIDSLTIMGELGAGAGIVSGAGRVAAKAGLAAARKAATRSIRQQLARGLMQAGATVGARGVTEGIARLTGEGGGQWTGNAIKRALPDLNWTEDELDEFATFAEEDFAERFLGKVTKEHPVFKGMLEDALATGVEATGGTVIGRIPGMAPLRAAQARVFQKLAGNATGAEAKRRIVRGLADVAAYNGAIEEVGEELLQGMFVEGAFGDGAMSGLPQSWSELVTIASVSAIPGAMADTAATAISLRQRAENRTATPASEAAQPTAIQFTDADMGRAVMVDGQRGTLVGYGNVVAMPDQGIEGEDYAMVQLEEGPTVKVPKSSVTGAPADQGTGGRQGTSTATGGDVISPPGEATAETAGVDPGVSTPAWQTTIKVDGRTLTPAETQEFLRKPVESFAKEARIDGAQAIEPRNDEEAAAVQMARNLGREIVLVSGRGGGRVSGMIDADGRMFVHAETASPLGVALHEMGHDLADKLGPEQFRAELVELEKVAPGMVARYRDSWMRRNEASQARDGSEGRFAGDEARSSTDPTADLATEEGFATLAEEYAALIAYASTKAGAKDMKLVAEYSPTVFRRLLDTVKRFVGKFKPDSPLGALERIEKATRQRPSQAAASLSLYLADLYKRGFGVDMRAEAGQEGGTEAQTAAAPDAEGSGSLLERLQAEAVSRGVPVVRPRPAAPAGAQGAAAASPATAAPLALPAGAAAATSPPPDAESQGAAAAVPALPAAAGGTPTAPTAATGTAFDGEQPARPDLNNPLATPEMRAVGDAVDEARNREGRPEPRSRKEDRDFARAELQRDYDGTRAEIETKLETGERLSIWETHALIQIMEDLSLAGLQGDARALGDAVRLFDAYREARSEAARELGTVVGLGRPAVMQIVDMIAMPSRVNRRKLAKIREEVDGMMRLLSPFKSSSARFLKTRHQMEQERRARRFAPNREMRFVPGVLDEMGRPLSEARLEALEAQRLKIEADEARRTAKAGEAVRNLGFDLDSMTFQDISAREMFLVRNAISVAKSTWTDKALEYRYMSLLSGVSTQAKNTAGNFTMLGIDGPVMKVAEATANLVIRDPESATFREVSEWFGGFAAALRPAFRNMVDAYRTQGPAFELELQGAGTDMGIYEMTFGSKLDFVPGPKIGGKFARALRTVSLNTLLASDEFFKTIAATAEVHSLAFRQASNEKLTGKERAKRMQELIDDKTSPIWTQALYKAREVTFQDEGGLASQKTAEVLNKIVGNLDDVFETYAKTPLGTILIPFRKTPVRIAARALRLTPLQTAMLPARAIAGDYKGNKGALVRDLADAMLAWGLTLSLLELLDMEDEEGRPFITGSRSGDSTVAALQYATAPPMSVRIGGQYLDYSRAEPFATALGMLVAMGDEYKRNGSGAALQAMLQASVEQTKDKTFLRTIGDLMQLADASRTTDDRFYGFVRDTLVTPLVPNIVRQTARESDDTLRERRTLDDGISAFWLDGIYPTATDDVAELTGAEKRAARVDAWGRPIKKSFADKGFSDSIYRMLAPLQPKLNLDESTKIDLALLAWDRKVASGEAVDGKTYYPGKPSRSFTVNGEKYTMPHSEYEGYLRDSGTLAAERILADTNINFDDPSERDIDRIKKHVDKARERVRNGIKADVRRMLQNSPSQLSR